MDALSRLGARAIGMAAAGAAIRPMIAPLFMAPPPDVIGSDADSLVIAPTSRHPVRQALDHDPGPTEPVVADLTDDERHPEMPRSQGRYTPVDLTPVDRAFADSEPLAPERARTARQDPPRSDVRSTRRADPVTVAEVDGSEDRLASTRGTEARRASDVRVHDPGEVVIPRESSNGEPRPDAGRTITGREPDGLSSARFLTRLRAIRESVAVPEPSHREERPPMVRVTIGRIDVRSAPAVAPEPPRQPARTPDSRITLAEYLTRKRQGAP